MSVANNFKKNFAGLLRGLLRKVDNGDYAESQPAQRPLQRQPAPAPVPQMAAAGGMTTDMQSIPNTFAHGAPARTQGASELEMPLTAILERLPAELRAKWMLGGVDLQAATISVPVKKVLPQLAQGAVKITFGEIRSAAPTLFRTGEEYDSLPISLPLNEVLSRLNPAMIPRNQAQRVIAAPPTDIAEPFGLGSLGIPMGNPAAQTAQPAHSAPIAPTAIPAKPATTHFFKKAAPPVQPIKMPTPPPVAAQPLPFVQRATTPVTPPPAPPVPPAAIPQPQQQPQQPQPLPFTPRATTPAVPPTPTPRVNFNGSGFQAPSPTRSANSLPGAIPPISGAKPFAPTPPIPQSAPPAARPVPPPSQALPPVSRPAPAPVPMPAPVQEAPSVLLPLSVLSEEWPEPLRQEIAQLNLSHARVALPIHLVEPALKRGRVVFSWQLVRSWIKPTPPGASALDGIELELPLKALLPLFMPAKKPAPAPNAKSELPPSSVPNLFFGFPQPQPEEMTAPVNMPEAAPIVKPLDAKLNDSNFYVWGENGEDPHLDETEYKRAQAPATDFSSRRALPNEIIERALKLPGVTGAIIALGDGLKVACQVPSDVNADTVAAFLPQLFSRVGQCSKELRMGELNNLNFTLGNIPWKIFRVNAVYFAAFGVAGVSLPTAQLAMLAGELDRKK